MEITTKTLDFNTDWKYSSAPESIDHIKIKERNDLFIGGAFIPPEKGSYFETTNPANEESLAKVADAELIDVDKAVNAARNAFNGSWSKMDAAERGKYIYRIARLIQ